MTYTVKSIEMKIVSIKVFICLRPSAGPTPSTTTVIHCANMAPDTTKSDNDAGWSAVIVDVG